MAEQAEQPEQPGRVAQLRTRAEAQATHVRRRWPMVELAVETFRRWRSVNGTVLAGSLAYRSFLFLVPLVLVIVGLLGVLRAEGVDVSGEASGRLGMAKSLAQTFSAAGEAAEGSQIQALTLGLSGVVIGALGLVGGVHTTMAQAWGLPIAGRKGKVKAVGKFLAAIPVAALILGLTLLIRRIGIIGGIGANVSSWISWVGGLLIIGWVMPHRAGHWRELLPGALVGGAAIVVIQNTYVYYLENHTERASEVYGSLGVVFGLLSYLFVLGAVLVLTALVSWVWMDRDQVLAGAPAPAPPPSPDAVGGDVGGEPQPSPESSSPPGS